MEAHTKKTEPEYQGNALADSHVKAISVHAPSARLLPGVPSMPDFCHPDFLTTWQQSEAKNLRWANDGCKLNEQSPKWETPDGYLVLPGSLANPIFQFLHSFTYCGAFEIIQIINRHQWGDL